MSSGYLQILEKYSNRWRYKVKDTDYGSRIKIYNSINLRLGYRLLEIRTPREILKLTDND